MHCLDTIKLKALTLHGKHGYYEDERINGNTFEIDVIASGDFKKAISNNNLEQTFNYEIVENIASDVINGPSELLIESLCYQIGELIFQKSPSIQKLKVSVRKINPPIQFHADYAEISMKWKR